MKKKIENEAIAKCLIKVAKVSRRAYNNSNIYKYVQGIFKIERRKEKCFNIKK